MKTPLEISIFKSGGQSALARALGVTPQAVQQWVKADRVPAEQCIAVENALNGELTRYQLRPDVFGPCPEKAA